MLKRLFLGLLLLQILLFALNPLSISKNELLIAEKKYGQSVPLRINDFDEHYKQWKFLSKEEQLLQINHYINGMLGQYDAYVYSEADYWATPKEFLLRGRGDCEDYVSLKFFTYKSLGFLKNELFYAVVKDRYSNTMHMVLLYYSKKKKLLVLDNLSSKVLPLTKRTDLTFNYAFNQKGIYTFNKNGVLVKTEKSEPKFKILLNKIAKGQ